MPLPTRPAASLLPPPSPGGAEERTRGSLLPPPSAGRRPGRLGSLLPPPSAGGGRGGGAPFSLSSLQPRRTRAGWQDIPHSVRKEGFAERGRPPGAGNAVTLP